MPPHKRILHGELSIPYNLGVAIAPSVVLLMTDTQRRDMISRLGRHDLGTPNLDGLIDRGVTFERASCVSPVCGPARSALFTGLAPHSNGVLANSMPLGETARTVGRRLSDAGVRCGYIGKWHLDGGDYFGMGRCPEGWDPAWWYDMRCYVEEQDPPTRRRFREVVTNLNGVCAEDTFAGRCAQRAERFLAEHGGERFLLVVSFDEPHHPFLCPPEFLERFEGFRFDVGIGASDSLIDKPAHHRTWAEAQGRLATRDPSRFIERRDFFACNSFVDDQIGRVLRAVERHAPEAMVMYTSDHGDMLGAHRIDGKGPAMYEEITGVPLIVRWPGVVAEGVRSSSVVSHLDVVPTLLEAFGVDRPPVLEGVSMMRVIEDPGAVVREAAFCEFHRFEVDHDGFGAFEPIRCAISATHKLVVNLLGSDELYDLVNDPHELTNRIDDARASETRDALHDLLLDWMYDTRDPFRGPAWSRRPWRKDAPRSTWDDRGMTRQRGDPAYEPHQLVYETAMPFDRAVRPKH